MAEVSHEIGKLPRLGLSHTALKAAIVAELEQTEEPDGRSAAIAEAVASAVEANNEEILRQLRQAFFSER
jgi:hypothetical protein